MALSLSAEQKSVDDIFYANDQYIIPNYQRPYSWGFEQCNQLYVDLLDAYHHKQDYFIGNIIIARSQEERKRPQVVDGQQRLMTIWLLLKVLSVLCPNLDIDNQYLTIPSKRKDGEQLLKIKSDVFETKDEANIVSLYKYSKSEFIIRLGQVIDKKSEIKELLCISRFEYVALIFFQNLCNISEDKLNDFTDFVLENVYLLPIELSGANMAEANDKALTIFETINNRGMSLENADIFKAKLYNKALTVHNEETFKIQWKEFRLAVDELNLSIDDIFRYYSHIIRGRENIISSEKNLRDFFLLDSASPLFKNEYVETMSDLMRIVNILQDLNALSIEDSLLGPWLQIINAYTNIYPKYAIVNYLYVNYDYNKEKLLRVLKSLIRYVYSFGASTTVKFEIYKIINKISQKIEINDYYVTDKEFDYNKFRTLRKGYALLYYYLKGGKLLTDFWYDKLLTNGDVETLKNKLWTDEVINDAISSIANTIVIDIPVKRKKMFDKYAYYNTNAKNPSPSSIFFDSACASSDFDKYTADYSFEMNKFFFSKI